MSNTITLLPSAPLPTDTTAQFNEKAFDLVASLDTFVAETNALAASVETDAAAAETAATTATTKASEALTSKNSAEAAEDNALAHKTAAEAAAAAAASSYDAFDDRYLGAKSSDPLTDNDGNALIEGAEYWNTTAKQRRTWDGTQWVVTFLPENGYVQGPSSATDGRVVVFDGITGKLVKQSAKTISDIENYQSASQAEMEAGTETALRSMSPIRVKQAISALASGGFSNMAVVTSSQTWTIPAGVTKLKVTVVGGGGNGGIYTNKAGASGGGGGGAAIKYLSGLVPGNTLSVTVGGPGGTSSVASGTQTISIISATGGGNGAAAGSDGGAGGNGSGGNINITGQGGGAGAPFTTDGNGGGGAGGSSIFGGGAPGASRAGISGSAYGGGASGSNYSGTGGTGYQGVVVFEY